MHFMLQRGTFSFDKCLCLFDNIHQRCLFLEYFIWLRGVTSRSYLWNASPHRALIITLHSFAWWSYLIICLTMCSGKRRVAHTDHLIHIFYLPYARKDLKQLTFFCASIFVNLSYGNFTPEDHCTYSQMPCRSYWWHTNGLLYEIPKVNKCTFRYMYILVKLLILLKGLN